MVYLPSYIYFSLTLFILLLCLLAFPVPAKYDVAVSTACSGLDYVVVETTAAAQACVELLRRKNLGVATFMILVTILNLEYILIATAV